MNDPNQKSGADFGQWQNTQSPQKFNQMLSRGGGTAFKPQGITPPGPNHSLDWSAGGGQELSKGGDRSWPSKWGTAGGQIEPPPRGGEGMGGGAYEGPVNGPFTPMGQMGPKGGPMGPSPFDNPRPGGGELGPQGPYTPLGGMDPKGGPMGDPRYPISNRPQQMPNFGGQMSPMQRSLMARRFQNGGMQPPPMPQAPVGDPVYPQNPMDQGNPFGSQFGDQYGSNPFIWRT